MLDFFATAQSFCGRSLQSVQLNGAHSSHSSCWPWRPARVRTFQDKAVSLMARRDRLCCLRRFGRHGSRPATLWGKSPFEVAESVIGRPKGTSSWTGSESGAEVQSALEFFATAHSFPEGCQAYKNEVYLLPTDLDEASQRTHREHSPSDVVGKSPCEVAESVIRRLQITSSWTSSGAECRDEVCVGVLRNFSHAVSGQFQSTVLSLALESVN